MEVICLTATKIFGFPGKCEVTLYDRRQYLFCSVIKHGLAPGSTVLWQSKVSVLNVERRHCKVVFFNWKCLNWGRCVFIIAVMVEEVSVPHVLHVRVKVGLLRWYLAMLKFIRQVWYSGEWNEPCILRKRAVLFNVWWFLW
jgi:hypothetical protein